MTKRSVPGDDAGPAPSLGTVVSNALGKMRTAGTDHALDATLLVSIVVEAHRQQRQLQRRLSHLDPLRRRLVETCVECLADERVPVHHLVAILRETLDGSDHSVRNALTTIDRLAEAPSGRGPSSG